MIVRERWRFAGERFSLAPLAPYWQRAGIWWDERSLREQMLLGSLAAIGIFALLLTLVFVPLREAREDAQTRIRNAALLEARLRTGGALAGQRFRRGTASAIITDSAAAATLTIQQVQPEGSDTRLTLTGVPFDKLMRWIADLEQTSRLRVKQVDIQRQAAAGLVNATIVVAG